MPGQPQAACPKCGKPADKRITGVHPVFKGTGFHATDYDAYGPKKPDAK